VIVGPKGGYPFENAPSESYSHRKPPFGIQGQTPGGITGRPDA
jgi:hypothetical protein